MKSDLIDNQGFIYSWQNRDKSYLMVCSNWFITIVFLKHMGR